MSNVQQSGKSANGSDVATSDTIHRVKQRTLRGKVTSDKMNKSRVLTVQRMVKDPTVGKYLKRSTKYMFHDEENASRVGDQVTIAATRPMSSRKSFILQSILVRSDVEDTAPAGSTRSP